jgi:flagellar basal-body rod protein FlgB
VAIFDTTQIALDQAMSGASLRQKAIAENIANANTPGYKRSDVDFHSTLQKAVESGDAGAKLEQVDFTRTTDTSSSMRADGNNVDIDEEMANLSQNSLDYQSLVAVSRARLQMLQSVLGSR